MFTENEWEYLLPQLESNGLLGVPLNVFWRESSLPLHIICVLTKNRSVYFFSITMYDWCTRWKMMKASRVV